LSNQKLLILWDIDGTIIRLSKDISKRHLDVVQEYTNKILIQPSSNLGKTDIGLIKEIFDINNLEFKRKDLQSCLKLLNLKSESKKYRPKYSVNPGIEGALEFTDEIGAINSILTGNSKARAIDKLRRVNLISKLSIELGFFGDQNYEREELVKSAKKELEISKKQRIILIGDAQRDIQAAKINGVKIISVATGKDSYIVLKSLNPDFIIKNFTTDMYLFKKIMSELI
jgi:phosphoglycolate phosphatase-like HAD superfamily hydrolase